MAGIQKAVTRLMELPPEKRKVAVELLMKRLEKVKMAFKAKQASSSSPNRSWQ